MQIYLVALEFVWHMILFFLLLILTTWGSYWAWNGPCIACIEPGRSILHATFSDNYICSYWKRLVFLEFQSTEAQYSTAKTWYSIGFHHFLMSSLEFNSLVTVSDQCASAHLFALVCLYLLSNINSSVSSFSLTSSVPLPSQVSLQNRSSGAACLSRIGFSKRFLGSELCSELTRLLQEQVTSEESEDEPRMLSVSADSSDSHTIAWQCRARDLMFSCGRESPRNWLNACVSFGVLNGKSDHLMRRFLLQKIN